MIVEIVVLGLQVFSIIFLLIALAYMVKNRIFERSLLESSVTSLIFALFLLFVMMIFSTVTFVAEFIPSLVAGITGLGTALNYLELISSLGIMPLYAVCVLVAVLLAQDRLSREKGTPLKEADKK